VFAYRAVSGRFPWSHGPPPLEVDRNESVARLRTMYACPRGHQFERRFAPDATPPDEWECPHHSTRAPQVQLRQPLLTAPPTIRKSHWDDLSERRSISELDELLTAALARRAQSRGGPTTPAEFKAHGSGAARSAPHTRSRASRP
jgi:hypothetical protein